MIYGGQRICWCRYNTKTTPRLSALIVTAPQTKKYVSGADEVGAFVTAPGPHRENPDGFLPLSLAISFFFMWAISGSGQPSNMVRLMAFKDTVTLRRSIFTVALYYSAIYFPLVIIFCCARVLITVMESEPDRIMPQIAVVLTENIGMGWLAGLLIAAPFAAVMSTVDSFLLMISSALVRDIYQRNLNPEATEAKIKKLSYIFTLVVGFGALLGAMNPPEFLQDIIVYTGSGLAAAFLAPVVYAAVLATSESSGLYCCHVRRLWNPSGHVLCRISEWRWIYALSDCWVQIQSLWAWLHHLSPDL